VYIDVVCGAPLRPLSEYLAAMKYETRGNISCKRFRDKWTWG